MQNLQKSSLGHLIDGISACQTSHTESACEMALVLSACIQRPEKLFCSSSCKGSLSEQREAQNGNIRLCLQKEKVGSVFLFFAERCNCSSLMKAI